MSKYSVSPSGDRTFTLVFLQRIVIAATVSLGMPYASFVQCYYNTGNEPTIANLKKKKKKKRTLTLIYS